MKTDEQKRVTFLRDRSKGKIHKGKNSKMTCKYHPSKLSWWSM